MRRPNPRGWTRGGTLAMLGCAIALALASRLASAASAPCAEDARALVVRGGTVLDTVSGARRRADVVVREGRVVAVDEARLQALPVCRVDVDAVGATVLPALADGHVHLASLLARGGETLAEWPRQGVTTVIDLGSRLAPDELAARVAASAPLTVWSAGRILTAPGGYPFAGDRSSALEVTSIAEVDAAIEASAAAGVDAVAHTPIEPLPEDQLREAVKRGVFFVSTAGLWTDREHVEALRRVRAVVRHGALVAGAASTKVRKRQGDEGVAAQPPRCRSRNSSVRSQASLAEASS